MLKFPKLFRFRNRKDFLRLKGAKTDQRVGKRLVVDIAPSPFQRTRLGITVTKRFGKAHERNRFKRQVREAFRLSKESLPKGHDIHIRPRTYAKGASSQKIAGELKKLLD